MSMCLLCTNFKGSDVWLTTFCTVNDMFCSLWNDIFKEQDNSNWKLTHTWWNRNLTLVAVQRQKCQTVQQVIKASTENSYERLSAGPEWLYFKGSTIALLTIHVSNVCMLILGVLNLLIMSGKQDYATLEHYKCTLLSWRNNNRTEILNNCSQKTHPRVCILQMTEFP